MTDEEMAIQAIRVSHQSPAHLSSLLRHWHDVLRIDCVDARPNLPALLMTVQEVVSAVFWWPDASTLDGMPHLLPGRRCGLRRKASDSMLDNVTLPCLHSATYPASLGETSSSSKTHGIVSVRKSKCYVRATSKSGSDATPAILGF